MNKQILGSLMTIALIGLVAGSSTVAYFNDTEASTDNVFEAGSLDLQIDFNESYNGELIEIQEMTDNPGAIYQLMDVKPGDSGEATVSLHLSDNDGWIWMKGDLTANNENNMTEPEAVVDETKDGELAENVETRLWYDRDCDNQYDTVENQTVQAACTAIIVDNLEQQTSSMKRLKTNDYLEPEAIIVNEYVDNGIRRARDILAENCDSKERKVVAILSNKIQNNGETEQATREALDTVDEYYCGAMNCNESSWETLKTIAEMAPGEAFRTSCASDFFKKLLEKLNSPNNQQLSTQGFSTLQEEESEKIIYEGNMEELFNSSNLQEGVLLDETPGTENCTAFENSTTYCIGHEWWVNRSVGNEIQTDSIEFNIEFYTEQERHNPDPANPWM